jgi:hypothetical protein
MLSGFFLGPQFEFDLVKCLNQTPVFPGAEIERAEINAISLDKLLEYRIGGHVSSIMSILATRLDTGNCRTLPRRLILSELLLKNMDLLHLRPRYFLF